MGSSLALRAQVSIGGLPPSFMEDRALPEKQCVAVDFDVESLKSANAALGSASNQPPYIAKAIPVSYAMYHSGTWTTLNDGRTVWQLRIEAKDALALLLAYNDFYIPEGGELYIYSADKTHVLGAYTEQTNPRGGAFSTEMVAGDDIILEYVSALTKDEILQATEGADVPAITIDALGYVFDQVVVKRFPKEVSVNTEVGESSACMININCSEGDDWQTEKKGVCQMTMYLTNGSSGTGWYVCSGTLINNTSQDLTPYILSAFHCYDGASTEDLTRWQFTFGYEAPGCVDENPEETHTIVGCYLRVAVPISNGSDGLLLELAEDVPASWDVYYNGWDRRNEVLEGGGVGIHHPAGDIKKISTFKTYDSATWPGEDSGATAGHWLFAFTETANGHSVTEGGSSGSSLFASNKLIIGTLTGGNSSCTNLSGSNYYGKLWYHWDQYGSDATTQMKTWLDPLDLGVETLSGTALNPSSPRITYTKSEIDLGRNLRMNAAGLPDSLTVKGYNLTDRIKASVPAPFELSTDRTNWSDTASLAAEGGALFVHYVSNSIGNFTDKISLSNDSINTAYIQVSGSSCPNMSFVNEELLNAEMTEFYSDTFFVANSSTDAVYFELTNGNLPEGLNLDFETGVLSGTAEEFGSFAFTVMATDENGCFTSDDYELYVICTYITEFPYTQDFENGFPECWDQSYGLGSENWTVAQGLASGSSSPQEAYAGDYNFSFSSESYDGNTTTLITPLLNLAKLENPVMHFAHAQPKWDFDQDMLEVLYRTSALEEWHTLLSYDSNIANWQLETVALPEPSGTYFIGFKATSNFGHGVLLDDLKIWSPGLQVTPKALDANSFQLDGDREVATLEYTGTDLEDSIVVRSTAPVYLSLDKVKWVQQVKLPASGASVSVWHDATQAVDSLSHIVAQSTATTCKVAVDAQALGVDGSLNAQQVFMNNPFSDILQLSWKSEFKYLQLVDVSGKVVYLEALSAGQKHSSVDGNDWSPGLYILTLRGEQSTQKYTVIKK